MDDIVKTLTQLALTYGLNLLAAIAILVVGRWVAGRLARGIQGLLRKRETEETVVSLAGSLSYALLMVGVILAALSKLGVQATTFVAVVGAAALAIGLALQGSLSNFAAGVMLAVFRPFRAGDVVEVAGVTGKVEDLQFFITQLATPDNKAVIVPNAQVTGSVITNYSAKDTRRVDMVIGVAYGEDLRRVKSALHELLAADDRVLKDPEPTIGVMELADSSVNLVVRPWTKTADYWDVYFDTMEAVKVRFDAEGISIPFPQTDVHLYEQARAS